MIIPELEEEAKTYHPTGVRIYTDDEDDTLLRYFGRVSKDSLLKHFPGKTHDSLRGHYRRIKKQQDKKNPTKTTDAAPARKPADGLPTGTPAGTPPISKEVSALPEKTTKFLHWTAEEIAIIDAHANDKDANAAWEKYREKFPDGRGKNAVYQKWYDANRKAKKSGSTSESGLVVRKQKALPLHQHPKPVTEPADPAIEDPTLGEWTEAEDAAIRDCPSEEAMLMRYMEKFSESNRRALDVIEHWKTIRIVEAVDLT